MLPSKLLRLLAIGLLCLFGCLILVGFAVWLHDWIRGPLNSEDVMPLEDWELGLGVGAFLLQMSAALESLGIGLGTRLRWIRFNQGRVGVGLCGVVSLVCAISTVQTAISPLSPVNVWGIVLYEFILLCPLVFAWHWSHVQQVE